MKLLWFVATGVLCATAAEYKPLAGADGSAYGRQELMARAAGKVATKSAMVFSGNTLIPSIGSGPTTTSELTFVNLESVRVGFTVRFFQFGLDSNDLYLNLADNGRSRGGHITLDPNEVFVLRTENTTELTEGWAVISTDKVGDCIGSFSKTVARAGDAGNLSVVLPTLDKYENKSVLVFDQSRETSIVSMFNGSVLPTNVKISIRNTAGELVGTDSLKLGAYTAVSVKLSDAYPKLPIQRGTITLEASDLGIASAVLQVGPLSISPVLSMSNPDWL